MPTQTFTGSGTWNRPDGVPSADVTVRSAGGGGGGSATDGGGNLKGGGGGGGGAIKSHTFTGLTAASYSVTVGTGGAAGTGASFPSDGTDGGNGGSSFWDDGSVLTVPGGIGGAGATQGGASNPPGGGGAAGDFNGGDGGAGCPSSGSDQGEGGGGGGGAGDAGNGGNGGDAVAGTRGSGGSGGSAGGGGGGGAPGGGGQGGGSSNAAAAGARGEVSVSYATAGHLTITAQPSTTKSGSAIGTITVEVRDSGETVDTHASGTLTVSIGTNANGGTLSGTLTQSPSSGVYTFSDLSIDNFGAGYTLTFTHNGASYTVTSSSFNITANHLTIVQQPTNAKSGAAISPSITVAAKDVNGNTDTNFTSNITLAISTNANGGTLSGTATRAAAAGIATFNDLSIDNFGSGYTLAASSSGLSTTTSDGFNITANHLTFTVQPTTTLAGTSMSPDVQVAAKDINGNTDTNFSSAITLAIGNNPGSSTLTTDTNPVSASSGAATFTHTSLNNVGVGYTLTAAATGLTGVTSNSFNIFVTDVLMGQACL